MIVNNGPTDVIYGVNTLLCCERLSYNLESKAIDTVSFPGLEDIGHPLKNLWGG